VLRRRPRRLLRAAIRLTIGEARAILYVDRHVAVGSGHEGFDLPCMSLRSRSIM
jgi:hypothetical protein